MCIVSSCERLWIVFIILFLIAFIVFMFYQIDLGGCFLVEYQIVSDAWPSLCFRLE